MAGATVVPSGLICRRPQQPSLLRTSTDLMVAMYTYPHCSFNLWEPCRVPLQTPAAYPAEDTRNFDFWRNQQPVQLPQTPHRFQNHLSQHHCRSPGLGNTATTCVPAASSSPCKLVACTLPALTTTTVCPSSLPLNSSLAFQWHFSQT